MNLFYAFLTNILLLEPSTLGFLHSDGVNWKFYLSREDSKNKERKKQCKQKQRHIPYKTERRRCTGIYAYVCVCKYVCVCVPINMQTYVKQMPSF